MESIMTLEQYLFEDENKLFQSIYENNFENFKNLIESGMDINTVDHYYRHNIMNLICQEDKIEFINYLIEKGINVNKPCYGTSPLQLACIESNFDTIRILIQNGADPITNVEDYACSETEVVIIKDIMNENYFVKPCCKK
jgi:ankyrin repeat protein